MKSENAKIVVSSIKHKYEYQTQPALFNYHDVNNKQNEFDETRTGIKRKAIF